MMLEDQQSRMRRILMVNKYYPPHLGGVESHVRDLSEGLVAAGDASVTALVAADSDEAREETLGGVDVVRVARAFEFASTPVAWGFRKRLTELSKRSDVVHFHFPYPYGEACSLLAHIDKPIVVTYHTDIVRQKKLLRLYRPLMERFLSRADAIVVSSPNLAEHSKVLAPYLDKVVHIDFGLPLDAFRATPAAVERASAVRDRFPEEHLLLFVGRLVPYKGVDVLLRALSKTTGDAHLVIVGTGPLESDLKQCARDLGVDDRVTFLKPAPLEELAALYRAADLFVLPSVQPSEAFGLVQIEAHASGTPVISTDLPTGVPYANLDGVTGRTVPVADASALASAIDELLGDETVRLRLAHAAQERAFRDFSIPRMCGKMVSLYDRLLTQGSATR